MTPEPAASSPKAPKAATQPVAAFSIPAAPAAAPGAAIAAIAAFAAIYGALSLLRYETFHSRSLDMAYYVRLVWGMAHGRPDNPVVGAPHWLGLHLEPILFPFAAVARLGLPVAETLLVAQALAAALALVPALALARRRLGPIVGDRGAFAAALAIYLVPTVSRCVDYDFHPTTLAIAPLLFYVDAVDAGRVRRAWIALAVALACREDVGLQISAAALACALPRRAPGRARLGGGTLAAHALVGAAWFFGYALLVQPRFLPDAADGSFGAHFERFGGGAGGVAGVLRAALGDPAGLLSYLASGDRLLYAPHLLATVALLPLAAPRWLAGALPIFGINLLSDFPGVRAVQSHYATAMAPFLVAAAILGAARIGVAAGPLARRAPRLRAAPAWVLFATAAAFWLLRGAAPLAPDFTVAAYRDDAWAVEARARVAAFAGAPRVVAEARLLAHLAERPEPLLDPAQRRYWKR